MPQLETLIHNKGNAATGGVWRVPGEGVLKVARPPSLPPLHPVTWPTSDDPAHWNYWQREVLAYRSGFAASAYADAGIVPPALLRTVDRTDGEIELWLADMPGAPGMSWPVSRLAAFARQLGRAQAPFADRVPDLPWLSRHWLAQYLEHGPSTSVRLSPDEPWTHPLWPADALEKLRAVWVARPALIARCEAVPRTLCHLDVWPNNLIEDGSTSVLLDWAFAGDGGIGEDPANLIIDSVTDGLMDHTVLPALAEAVITEYAGGLRDGGWTGSADDVRRWIMLFGVTKYSWFAPALLGRMKRDGTLGQQTYGKDTTGDSAMLRLQGLIRMLGDWAAAVL
ncbi:phosphotransferase [Actinoplanes sp. NBRC 103695]|uniref:phosphotransferase n=1 Tax=Actinoplanes sp. NBRC 103695 TaxID=3032202 RepID=UPI0024A3D0DE|nr:phosphotransferase [Actinoplanes sp. NBRC 103695]GLY96907.1 hypothetical protein Acsp02_41610 [Actinoplanes sp. NBRC 103695]